MFEKINIPNKLQEASAPYIGMFQEYLRSLRDIRNIGVLVFTVIVLLISWSGIKTIQTNYGLQKQIATLQQQNDVASLRNQNLKLQNQYFTTPQYLDITARQNLGLAAPGETELLISDETALGHTTAPAKTKTNDPSSVPEQPTWQRNFRAWTDFFLGRDSTN